MEGQTPSRKGKMKSQRTDLNKSVPHFENTADLASKRTLDNTNIKRNGTTFVLTAPNGRTLTTKAKTRLIFDPSNSSDLVSNRSPKFSNSTSRNLEDNNLSSSQEIPRSINEKLNPNFSNRTKETLNSSNLTSGRVDDKNFLNCRDISLLALETLKQNIKSECEAPNLKQKIEYEGDPFPFTGRFIHEKLPRRSSSICPSRPSLTGNRTTPISKLHQRARKLSLSSKRHRTEAAFRLKAMVTEEMQASRDVQAKKDLWLDRQERAYCAWLNFVLKQPMKIRLLNSSSTESVEDNAASTPSGNRGTQDSFLQDKPGRSENEGYWRTPKRPRIKSFRASAFDGLKSAERNRVVSSHSLSETCLQNICSVSDLRQRLEIYLDPSDREDVISTMIKLAKYIDDGRLKMKEECAILTDLALKEKAVQVLMNYNVTWLRIGLHIVLGHNALVTKVKPCLLLHERSSVEENAEVDNEFLKLLIEKHFLGHAGLSKCYASNKSIDGLYRPGYYEALGRVILKRFFLFVLSLDKAKSQSALPIRNGIDGLDGGSPLLFYPKTFVKSSRQALQHFLSDVMHGEGDLLGHLATIGYQVSHVQAPLVEYDFSVTNLVENLRDGVRLCRLVQLMVGDASILMRVIVPCDYQKKHLHNCNTAIQYLIEAGVPLNDEEGYPLTAEDLAMGDRERILSLLWSIFVHLQMPLLISKERLCDEIAKIRGPENSDMELSSSADKATLTELMLTWIQAICATYGQSVDNFRSSFADGQAFWYLIDFYVPGFLPTYLLKEAQCRDTLEATVRDSSETKVAIEKFGVVQDVIKNMRNIPEVLETTDLLEGDPSCNERNVIILLAFLSAWLLEGKSVAEHLFTVISGGGGLGNSEKAVLDEHGKQVVCTSQEEMAAIKIQSFYRSLTQRRYCLRLKRAENDATKQMDCMEAQVKAVIQIQSWQRALNKRRQFLKIKAAVSHIQSAVRAWLTAKHLQGNAYNSYPSSGSEERKKEAAVRIQSKYRSFIKRKQFLRIKSAVSYIQSATRSWLVSKHINEISQGLRTCTTVQEKSQDEAATIIQSHHRALTQRQKFLKFKAAISHLQRAIRAWLAATHNKENDRHGSTSCTIVEIRKEKASTIIQSHYRALTERRRFLKVKKAVSHLQRAVRAWLAATQHKTSHSSSKLFAVNESKKTDRVSDEMVTPMKAEIAAIIIQSHIRGWLQRSRYISLFTTVLKIQRMYRAYRIYRHQIMAAVKIQCAWKRAVFRSNVRRLWYASIKIQACWQGLLARKYFKKQKVAAVRIQSCYRGYRCQRQYKICRDALIKIQSFIRGRILSRSYYNYKVSACKVQRCFRGWLVRKEIQRAGQVHSCSTKSTSRIQTVGRNDELNKFAKVIQAAFRGWQEKQKYKMTLRMIIRVQAIIRGILVRKSLLHDMLIEGLEYAKVDCKSQAFQMYSELANKKRRVEAARTIQQFYRGYAARSFFSLQKRELLFSPPEGSNSCGLSSAESIPAQGNHDLVHNVCSQQILIKYVKVIKQRRQFLKVRQSVLKLQRWWRDILAHRSRSALVIQSHFRGWASRRVFSRAKHAAVLIQACWRSYLVRNSQVQVSQQLSNLRFRMQNSAANVDDRLRLENRLTEALEVLLNHKTVSGILHTCVTLDIATQHSTRCCECLVAAGAIDKLLQLIQSTNRSAPHEEVLKHALSVLSNIAHYPNLAQIVVDTPGSINTIVEQLLRNKEEAFSKAVEVLKKLCAVQNGADAVQKLPPIVRRLQCVAQNLERKVEIERRSLARLPQKAADVTRKAAERKLREAISQHRSILLLLQSITGESSRRRSEVHRSRPYSDRMLKRASSGPIELSRHDIKGRSPFQDCSNN